MFDDDDEFDDFIDDSQEGDFEDILEDQEDSWDGF